MAELASCYSIGIFFVASLLLSVWGLAFSQKKLDVVCFTFSLVFALWGLFLFYKEETQPLKRRVGVWFLLRQWRGQDIERGTTQWLKLRRHIWRRDYKRCKQCNRDLSHGSYHCHHVHPVSRGGPGEPSNLVTLCERCHQLAHRGWKGMEVLQ